MLVVVHSSPSIILMHHIKYELRMRFMRIYDQSKNKY